MWTKNIIIPQKKYNTVRDIRVSNFTSIFEDNVRIMKQRPLEIQAGSKALDMFRDFPQRFNKFKPRVRP